MKKFKIINLENYAVENSKDFENYLNQGEVRLETTNDSVTFLFPNDNYPISVHRICDAIDEVLDMWIEPIRNGIDDKVRNLGNDETITWDNNVGNFVD